MVKLHNGGKPYITGIFAVSVVLRVYRNGKGWRTRRLMVM